jgi:hypothetical protein
MSKSDDTISRQDAIDAFRNVNLNIIQGGAAVGRRSYMTPKEAVKIIENLPSAQPEPLTDKEQRIFLAAIGREEKVCKQVDEECRDCREPYEDSLVRTCHEITRKVKGSLWT